MPETKTNTRRPEIGEVVMFRDTNGRDHFALVTTVHSVNGVNLCYVSGDDSREDGWGRQIERAGSVVHVCLSQANGYFFRFLEDKASDYGRSQL